MKMVFYCQDFVMLQLKMIDQNFDYCEQICLLYNHHLYYLFIIYILNCIHYVHILTFYHCNDNDF